MKYLLNDKEYTVVIVRKNNKNTYIRVKEDEKIYVTTNYFVTTGQIKKLLNNHSDDILKMLNNCQKKQEQNKQFYYLGKPYDIIYMSNIKMEWMGSRIYVKDEKTLNRWLKKEMFSLYEQELNKIYNMFEENIPYPNLKIRYMKTRWGVCNRKNNNVTINSELIKYDIEKLDYVIVHELSHFVHFNHSSSFWGVVSKYCPDYKRIRKELKE